MVLGVLVIALEIQEEVIIDDDIKMEHQLEIEESNRIQEEMIEESMIEEEL